MAELDSALIDCVVLAAGRGKRLRPISDTVSKAMTPILGRALIERVIQALAAAGLRKFTIVASPDDESLTEFIGNELNDSSYTRVVFQDRRLGTAHALKICRAEIESDNLVVTACDSLFATEHIRHLLDVHRENGNDATLTLKPSTPEQIARTSSVELDGSRIVRIVEKPAPGEAPSNMACIQLYVFGRVIFEYLDRVAPSVRGEYELPDAFQMMMDDGLRFEAVKTDWRMDITCPRDIVLMTQYFMDNGETAHSDNPLQIGPGTEIIEPVVYEDDSAVGADCVVGPYVYLGEGARIGSNVQISNSVLMAGASLADGVEMSYDVIV